MEKTNEKVNDKSATTPPTTTTPNNTNEVLTETKYGKFVVLKNDYIGKFFVKGTHYEQNVVDMLVQNLKPGDTVIDVGGHIGTHTIPYAQAVGENGKVFVFEPQSIMNRILKHNIGLNGLTDRVQVFHNAVGHKNCQTTLNCKGDGGIPLNYKAANGNFGGLNLGPKGEPIEMVTLDSMRSLFPNGVKYIKMDVEGAEPLVIFGARRLIEDFRPYVFFEHNYKRITKEMIEMYNLSKNIVNFDMFDFFLKELNYKEIVKHDNNYYAIPQ